jgi:hypothetical protein
MTGTKGQERFGSFHLDMGTGLLPTGHQFVLDHFTGYSLVIDWHRKEDDAR